MGFMIKKTCQGPRARVAPVRAVSLKNEVYVYFAPLHVGANYSEQAVEFIGRIGDLRSMLAPGWLRGVQYVVEFSSRIVYACAFLLTSLI